MSGKSWPRAAALAALMAVAASVAALAAPTTTAAATDAQDLYLTASSALAISTSLTLHTHGIEGLVDAVYGADGHTAFALGTGPLGSEVNAVSGADLAAVSGPADFAGTPVSIGVIPGTFSLAVLTSLPNALVIVDPATLEVAQSIALPHVPTQFVVSPDGSAAYVVSSAGGDIQVVDLTSGTLGESMDFDGAAVAMVMSNSGGFFWVGDGDHQVVKRYSTQDYTHINMPLPDGHLSLSDLDIQQNPEVLLVLDRARGQVYVTSQYDLTFRNFGNFDSPAVKLAPAIGGRYLDAFLSPSSGVTGVITYDLGSSTYDSVQRAQKGEITDVVRVPSVSPQVLSVSGPSTANVGEAVTFTAVPGTPAPDRYVWVHGGTGVVTTGPTASLAFTKGDATTEVTVTGLDSLGASGRQLFDGRHLLQRPGDSTATTTIDVRSVLTKASHYYDDETVVHYLPVPENAISMTIVASGSVGHDGETVTFPDGSLQGESLPGYPGGAGLRVTSTVPIGGTHFVQPGDTLGIIVNGAYGNLYGGQGGTGSLAAGDGGAGGNGSGVFLQDENSVHPWLVVAPGGGGGGGAAGFAKGNAAAKGGAAALNPDDTRGFTPSVTEAGDGVPGASMGYCVSPSVTDKEHLDGPYSTGPSQDGLDGGPGEDSSSAGGGGGGGAGCFAGSGATSAGPPGGPGSGGGGGVAYSRYSISNAVASNYPDVKVTFTYWAGGAPSLTIDPIASPGVYVGLPLCIPVHLAANTVDVVGPVTLAGASWLALTKVDDYDYQACGTPPNDPAQYAFTVEVPNWGASQHFLITTAAPGVRDLPTHNDVHVNHATSIAFRVEGFSSTNYTVSASGLPTGLALTAGRTSSDFAITGAVPPGNDGTYVVTIHGDDGTAQFDATTSLRVYSLPDAAVALAGAATGVVGTAAIITASVSNSGADRGVGDIVVTFAPTPVGVIDSLGGAGWLCDLALLRCTSQDGLDPGATLPVIAVGVLSGAVGQVDITATVAAAADVNGDNDAANFAVDFAAAGIPGGTESTPQDSNGSGTHAGPGGTGTADRAGSGMESPAAPSPPTSPTSTSPTSPSPTSPSPTSTSPTPDPPTPTSPTPTSPTPDPASSTPSPTVASGDTLPPATKPAGDAMWWWLLLLVPAAAIAWWRTSHSRRG